MVAGIILAAVGDELTLTHPTGHTDTTTLAAVVGGPALFLAGHLSFKGVTFGHFSTARPVALAGLALLAAVGSHFSPLLLSATTTLIVASVVVWDIRVVRRVPDIVLRKLAEETDDALPLDAEATVSD